MLRLKTRVAAWVAWAALAVSALAQSRPEWLENGDWSKPPDQGIRDNSAFFSKNSGAGKRISEKLRVLAADHGFPIYLVVEPVFIGTSATELAAVLQDSWLPENSGLVVVFEGDSRSLGFGRNGGGTPGEPPLPGQVPTHIIAGILDRVVGSTDKSLSPENYIESLMVNLSDEFSRHFEKRKAPPPPGRTMRLVLLTVGALTLLALGTVLVGSLNRLPSVGGTKTFRFPEVSRPERLGAPCGGGNVTSRRFGAGRPS